MSGSHDHHHSHDHAHDHAHDQDRWKHDGVRVIPGNQLDSNVALDGRYGPQGCN